MALDIFTSSVISFLPLIFCSQAQHFFSNLKGYMCVHTCVHMCARTYIHTWIWNIYVLFHFIILFFIGPKSWRVSATPRGSKRCMGSVIATWPVCDGTWLLVVQSAFVGTERVIWEVWQARKGGLSLWGIWMPQGYPRETMLNTGP